MTHAFLAGFGLSLSLIVAPGAQNVFLLRMGIQGRHVMLLALVCIVSDMVLICAGVLGFGVAVTEFPWLVRVASLAGAIFLAGYGVIAAWRALFPPKAPSLDLTTSEPGIDTTTATPGAQKTMTRSLAPAIMSCLAFTWLNPHTYLDTVFLVGSVSTNYGADRWIFGMGAMLASAVWFLFLARLARFAARWFSQPRAWRILDAGIAVVMITLAILLVVG